MPYNGSGGFSLAQSAFLPNTVISSSEMNSDLSDIATNGLTNAVTKDGQTTITAPFKGASGSVGLPMYSFAADPDGGMYRIGANNIGISVNATKILDIATTGLTVTGSVTADSLVVPATSAFSFVPAGVMFPYGGTSAPTGFLLCFGQSLLRSDFPDLFTAIGTTFGSADGTHFSLPDLRGRGLFGKDDMGGSAANRITTAGSGIDGTTLGASGGAQNVTISTANVPQLTVAITDPGHNHPITTSFVTITAGNGGTPTSVGAQVTVGATNSNTTGITATANTSSANTALNKMPPTLIVNVIIKT